MPSKLDQLWNPKWQPRNGSDGSLMAKTSITIIQVSFVYRFTWIVTIRIFTIKLPSQQYLGRHFGFHSFFLTVHFALGPQLFFFEYSRWPPLILYFLWSLLYCNIVKLQNFNILYTFNKSNHNILKHAVFMQLVKVMLN